MGLVPGMLQPMHNAASEKDQTRFNGTMLWFVLNDALCRRALFPPKNVVIAIDGTEVCAPLLVLTILAIKSGVCI
jgi:hypothetical protein